MENKKIDRIKFTKEVENIILLNGGVLISDVFDCKMFEIALDENSLGIRLYNEKDHKVTFCVFMRFETPLAGLGNSYSGKHNFFSVKNVEVAIKEFEIHLKNAIKTNNDRVEFRKEKVL